MQIKIMYKPVEVNTYQFNATRHVADALQEVFPSGVMMPEERRLLLAMHAADPDKGYIALLDAVDRLGAIKFWSEE